MGAVLRVFVALRYGFTRVGRNFEGFAMLLRARWWDAGEVYASDLIHETSPLGGCRSQGLP
jgi:hypothetical protein